MRIPESKIDEIRNSANILDVISGYVQMRKRGKNYIGLCPFHQEKTPSFTVSEEKQIYHCFGCHAGGNVFKFLMEYKNISFVESVQEVAEFIGIKIELEERTFSEDDSEQERLYEINVIAAKFFSNNLLNSDEGERARNYFKNRNIKPQTQKIFGLGFAESVWESLLFYLKDNKVDLSRAKNLGLIDTRDDGKYYDKYRGRIMFPVFSPNGRVIAFGGRILNDGEKAAKYINSPESLIYSKRKSLYGLFHSKDEIRKLDRVVMVEGYMDLISLYQHGIKNVVASSGTSLTEEQIQLLSRFTKNIIIIYDADIAGQKASLRSIELLLKQDFDVRLVSLPENEDPDSFINNFGTDEFRTKINGAKNFLEYQTDQFAKQGLFEDPTEQTKAIRELVKSAALVSDELKRNLIIKSISKKFNLREKVIEKELDSYMNQFKKQAEQQQVRIKRTGVLSSQANSTMETISEVSSYEKELIKLLLEGKEEIIELIYDYIHPNDFTNEMFKIIAGKVEESYRSGKVSPAAIIESIEDENIKSFILSFSINEESISRRWEERSHNGKIELKLLQQTKDLIKKYRKNKIDEQIKLNIQKIATLEDEENKILLLKENNELYEQIKLISNGNGNSDLI